MTTMRALESIAAELRTATAGIQLDRADSQPGQDKTAPVVVVGYTPPRNADLSSFGEWIQAPCVIVGMGEAGGNDDGREGSIPVMITVGTYSPGEAGDNGRIKLNNEGWIDLMNLIDTVKHALCKKPVLKATTIEKPISWGMYQDQPYPYWYGWLSFDAKVSTEDALPDADQAFLSELNLEMG